jgi:vacuolar protein sorting-associated protein 13A/C
VLTIGPYFLPLTFVDCPFKLVLSISQVSSRKITGVGDGLVQGTEAFAQGVAFGVSGVLTKPVESVRQYGLLGFAHGLGRAFIGFIVQPLSGLLDFGSLTVDGIGASFIRCLEILNNKSVAQRIRNPRAIHSDGVVREYSNWEACGQVCSPPLPLSISLVEICKI